MYYKELRYYWGLNWVTGLIDIYVGQNSQMIQTFFFSFFISLDHQQGQLDHDVSVRSRYAPTTYLVCRAHNPNGTCFTLPDLYL